MKPLRLEFCGIKSYTQKTVINFEKLLKDGVFGIFGNTGSGKSTILDSIILALYGTLPNSALVSDFIAFKDNKAYIDFEFAIKEFGQENTYRIRRNFTINRAKQTNTHKAFLSILTQNGETPLCENAKQCNEKLNEIIGLSLNDFEMCIILPQGEFAAFVSLNKQPRLKMVSSLFNLDKFGTKLIEKIKPKLQEDDKKIYALDESLKDLENVTPEAIELANNDKENEMAILESQNVIISKITDEYNENKKYYDTHNLLISAQEKFLTMEKLIPQINEKKKRLDNYYKAVSAKKCFDDSKRFLSEYEILKNRSKLIEQDFASVNKQLELADKQVELNINRSNELVELNVTLSKLHGINDDYNNNTKKLNKLKLLREDFLKLDKSNNNLLSNIETINDKLKKLNERGLEFDFDNKISQLLTELSMSTNNGFINEEINFLLDLNNDYKTPCDKLLTRINKLKGILNQEKLVPEEIVLKLQKLYDDNKKHMQEKMLLNTELLKCNSEIKLNNEKLSQIKIDGEKLKEETRAFDEKIKEIIGDKNYTSFEKEVNENINNLNKAIISAVTNQKEFKKKSDDMLVGLAEIKKEIEFNKCESDKNYKDFENEINGVFVSIEEIEALIISVKNYNTLKIEIDNFYLNYKSLEDKINEYNKTLNGIIISETILNDSKQKLDEALLKRDEITKKIEKYSIICENLSHNYSKRCIMEDKRKELSDNRTLNSSLYEVIKSNGLVEYVADEYLREIAGEAKNYLLALTDGRYGLRYESDFLIEDNLSGGDIRRVNTVSGGELFLVSLSLALSLSKSIYAKSSKPIEFFFLDEGFGSLDKGLVETVMDCLTKLKNSCFSIGVISHVEALKDRIEAKILVSGATDTHGSTLTVIA